MPAKKNAFFFFMQELHREMTNRGENVSFPQMSSIASPHWKAMTPEQKLKYQNMQKAARGEPQTNDPNQPAEPMRDTRMNNQRVLMSDFDDARAAHQERQKAREDEVKGLRKYWPPGNEFIEQTFYLVHAEYFVKTLEGAVCPCEISALKYSLADGIIEHFHTFIDPGPPPRGYTGEELSRSEDRHQIPTFDRYDVEDFDFRVDEEEGEAEEEKNERKRGKEEDDKNNNNNDPEDDIKNKLRKSFKDYSHMYSQLVRFFDDGSPNKRAFTALKEVDTVQAVLDWIFDHAKADLGLKHNQKDLPKVLPLGNLVQQFYMHSQSDSVDFVPALHSIELKLSNDKWNYTSKTRCFFHEAKDVPFCTTGQVNRWAYSIFETVKGQKLYAFDITPNHIPPESKAAFRVVSPGDPNVAGLAVLEEAARADVERQAEAEKSKICRVDRRPEYRDGKNVLVLKENEPAVDSTGKPKVDERRSSASNDASLASSFGSLGISGESKGVGGAGGPSGASGYGGAGPSGASGYGGAWGIRAGYGRGIVRDHVGDAHVGSPVDRPRRLGMGRGRGQSRAV